MTAIELHNVFNKISQSIDQTTSDKFKPQEDWLSPARRGLGRILTNIVMPSGYQENFIQPEERAKGLKNIILNRIHHVMADKPIGLDPAYIQNSAMSDEELKARNALFRTGFDQKVNPKQLEAFIPVGEREWAFNTKSKLGKTFLNEIVNTNDVTEDNPYSYYPVIGGSIFKGNPTGLSYFDPWDFNLNKNEKVINDKNMLSTLSEYKEDKNLVNVGKYKASLSNLARMLVTPFYKPVTIKGEIPWGEVTNNIQQNIVPGANMNFFNPAILALLDKYAPDKYNKLITSITDPTIKEVVVASTNEGRSFLPSYENAYKGYEQGEIGNMQIANKHRNYLLGGTAIAGGSLLAYGLYKYIKNRKIKKKEEEQEKQADMREHKRKLNKKINSAGELINDTITGAGRGAQIGSTVGVIPGALLGGAAMGLSGEQLIPSSFNYDPNNPSHRLNAILAGLLLGGGLGGITGGLYGATRGGIAQPVMDPELSTKEKKSPLYTSYIGAKKGIIPGALMGGLTGLGYSTLLHSGLDLPSRLKLGLIESLAGMGIGGAGGAITGAMIRPFKIKA